MTLSTLTPTETAYPSASVSPATEGMGAIAAAKRGWYVFPIKHGTKEAACKWTTVATNDVESVRTWCARYSAYGIACGPSGLVVIDEDATGELERWSRDTGLSLPPTLTVNTGKGRHLYYLPPEGVKLTNHSRLKAEGYNVDVRGNGGYVLGPGSAHPKGGCYTLEDGTQGVAELPSDVVEWMTARPTRPTPSQSHNNSGSPFDDFEAQTDWEDILTPAGWSYHHSDRDGTRYWTRPGKNVEEGYSATTDRPGERSRLFVFSTSTPFAPETTYTKAVAWAVLNEYGETPEGLKRAAAALREKGYGGGPAAGEEFSQLQTVPSCSTSQRASAQLVADIVLTPATSVKVRRPRWLKRGWYPLGVVTIVAGVGGEGKSTLVLSDAAKLTRGELDTDKEDARNVVISAIEDDKGIQCARLAAAGADLNRVSFLDLAYLDSETGEIVNEGAPSIPAHLGRIREQLKAASAAVWIIDPLTSVIPGDLNSREDVRAALDPLTALARELDIAVIGVCHFNKGAGRASTKLAGSAAFRDVARSVILVASDPDNGERVATIDKSNYGESAGKSYRFAIESAEAMDEEGEPFTVPRACYLGESTMSVDDIINRQSQPSDPDRKEVEEWLVDYLKSCGGKAAFKDIEKAAQADGWSKDQVKKARAHSGSLIRFERSGYPATTYWVLDFEDVPEREKSMYADA